MTKYNKSNIMRNAWALRKSANVSMSIALKSAWALEKAMIKKRSKSSTGRCTLSISAKSLVSTRIFGQCFWDELQKMEKEYPELKDTFGQIQKEENIAYEVRNSTLKGSEKQIAWAAEIQYKIRQVFDAAITHFDGLQDIRKDEAKMLVRERWGRIYDAKYAGDIIDLFGHIHFSGDAAQDFGKICAVYKTSVPTTEGQKEILGK